MSKPPYKYAPIRALLENQEEDLVRVSLDRLAELVGTLPKEAFTPQFWSNAEAHHTSRRGQWLDAGFHAFLEPAQRAVRFERYRAVNDRHNQDWTDIELRACVRAYRALWLAQSGGQEVRKTSTRDAVLADALVGRNRKAYEFRMQNISSLLSELGIAWVEGYRPAQHVGPNVARRLLRMINEEWVRENEAELPTADRDELETRLASAQLKVKVGSPPNGSRRPARSRCETTTFARDPNVIAWVKRVAAGVCEACDQPAPFTDANGEPFLEVHHVRPLAEDGPDTIDNAAALCPNCHRKLHYSRDRQTERRRLIKKVDRLVDYAKGFAASAG